LNWVTASVPEFKLLLSSWWFVIFHSKYLNFSRFRKNICWLPLCYDSAQNPVGTEEHFVSSTLISKPACSYFGMVS
jgi:hypothetical protein